MSTDEIREAFHSAFEPVVGGVTVDPALSSVVRRRYAREQRLLSVGAAFGVVAVAAGAAAGVLTSHSADSHPDTAVAQDGGSPTSEPTPTPTPTPEALQTVSLVGHDVSLPSDWVLSGNRKLIDLDTFQPAQPLGGKDQSVTATSPDGTRKFRATVYTGPIADAERGANAAEDDPSFSHVKIDGLMAAIHISGPPTQCLQPATQTGTGRAKQSSPTYTVGYCPTPGPPGELYGEARYTFGNGDFMMVDTYGMDDEDLTSFLTTALSD